MEGWGVGVSKSMQTWLLGAYLYPLKEQTVFKHL